MALTLALATPCQSTIVSAPKRLWTLNSGASSFPMRQVESNKMVSDRYATSWSVQRGHHFFLWHMPHGAHHTSRWGGGTTTSAGVSALDAILSDTRETAIQPAKGTGFTSFLGRGSGGSVRVVSPVGANGVETPSQQGGFRPKGFVRSSQADSKQPLSLFRRLFSCFGTGSSAVESVSGCVDVRMDGEIGGGYDTPSRVRSASTGIYDQDHSDDDDDECAAAEDGDEDGEEEEIGLGDDEGSTARYTRREMVSGGDGVGGSGSGSGSRPRQITADALASGGALETWRGGGERGERQTWDPSDSQAVAKPTDAHLEAELLRIVTDDGDDLGLDTQEGEDETTAAARLQARLQRESFATLDGSVVRGTFGRSSSSTSPSSSPRGNTVKHSTSGRAGSGSGGVLSPVAHESTDMLTPGYLKSPRSMKDLDAQRLDYE